MQQNKTLNPEQTSGLMTTTRGSEYMWRQSRTFFKNTLGFSPISSQNKVDLYRKKNHGREKRRLELPEEKYISKQKWGAVVWRSSLPVVHMRCGEWLGLKNQLHKHMFTQDVKGSLLLTMEKKFPMTMNVSSVRRKCQMRNGLKVHWKWGMSICQKWTESESDNFFFQIEYV